MLIGVTGKAGAGKDTVAHIIEKLVPRVAIYSFAKPLKDMALAVDPILETSPGLDPYRLSDAVGRLGWDGAKKDPEVRRFLQRLGTEGVRGTFGDDAWVDLMWRWYDSCHALDFDLGVIPDVRFQNEADAVRWCGFIVEVVRPDALDLGANATHASEHGGIRPDAVIWNDSDIPALEMKVWRMLDERGIETR